MNRKVLFAVLAAAILVVVVVVIAIGVSSVMNKDKELVIIGFDYAKARVHLDQLVANGPRNSGSEAEETGAEYIVGQWEAAGLQNCHIEKYSVPLFQVNNAEASLVEYMPLMNFPNPLATPQSFVHMQEFVVQGYSGSWQWNNFRDDLPMVFIGNGTDPESYNAAAGAACLIEDDLNTPGNPTVFQYAVDAGVTAIVLQNLKRGEEIGFLPFFKTNYAYVTWQGEWPEIPFFMVSRDMGETLKTHTGDSKLRLNFDVTSGPMDLCVAVGEIPGSMKSDDLYVIGAHHDTVYNGVGAVDDTSGTAVVTQLAIEMAKYKPKYTIRFCTFGGEEEGLFGSEAYFAAHESELVGHVKWMFNFDMPHVDIERGNGFTFTTAKNSTIKTFKEIRDKMSLYSPELKKYTIDVVWDDGKWEGSDQWPFASNDIPVTNAWGSGSWEYHTYKDDTSRINEESFQISGKLVGSFLVSEAC